MLTELITLEHRQRLKTDKHSKGVTSMEKFKYVFFILLLLVCQFFCISMIFIIFFSVLVLGDYAPMKSTFGFTSMQLNLITPHKVCVFFPNKIYFFLFFVLSMTYV